MNDISLKRISELVDAVRFHKDRALEAIEGEDVSTPRAMALTVARGSIRNSSPRVLAAAASK